MESSYEQFADYLLAGDQDKAWEFLYSKTTYMDSFEIFTSLVQDALVHVGLLWQQNKISVANEHLATSTCDYVLAKYQHAVVNKKSIPTNNKLALFSCVEGEEHYIGIRMTSILFEEYGWKSIMLGPNQSLQNVLKAAEAYKPDLIGLSCTMIKNAELLSSYTNELSNLSFKPDVLVGSRLIDFYDFTPHCAKETILVSGIESLKSRLQAGNFI